jgi:hypothetical protein
MDHPGRALYGSPPPPCHGPGPCHGVGYGVSESRGLGALGGIGENHETLQIVVNAGNDAFGEKLSKDIFS